MDTRPTLWTKLGYKWCWLKGWIEAAWRASGEGGHPYIKTNEYDRVFLECVLCGHQTVGWDLSAPKPKSTSQAWNRADFKEAYNEFVETELSLHCGG